MITINDLVVQRGGRPIIDGVSLHLRPGESVAVMGPSGTGKSTLLGAITGLIVPSSGTIDIQGHAVTGLDADARARLRRDHMGLVFQSADLLPELSIEENVALTLLFDGMARGDALALAGVALESVGIAHLAQRRTDEVSGGEAQRVALARALVRPGVALIVADEPTASLDQGNAQAVTGLLLDSARERGAACVLATHDPAVAARCDRVLRLEGAAGGVA